MRQFVYTLFGMVLTACFFVACSSLNEESGYSLVDQIILDVLPMKYDAAYDGDSIVTRATVTGTGINLGFAFEHGDTIGIFPDMGYQIPFVLPLEEGETASSVIIEAQGWMTKDGVVYSSYLPYDFYNRYYNKIPWDFSVPQVQSSNNKRDHLGARMFMACDTTRADSGKFHASLQHMACILRIQCVSPATADYRKIVLTVNDNVFATKGTFDIFDVHKDGNGKHTAESQPFHADEYTNFVYVLLKSGTRNSGQTLTGYLVVPPTDMRGKTITAYIWTSEGVCYTGSVTADNTDTYNWTRGTIKNIAFTSFSLTTTPTAYVTPYDSEVGLGGVALE